MSIILKTKTPKKLIRLIKDAIDDDRISAWRYDSDGDFTSNLQEMENKGWFHPIVTVPKEELVLAMLGRINAPVTIYEYAIYHSMFVNIILHLFDDVVSDISVTPQPTKYDRLIPRNPKS